MKKIFSLFAALTLSAGLWAETQTVSYLYPVYNTDGVATSGIKEWKTGEVEATVVEMSGPVSVTWNAGWYVVKGTYIALSKGAVCSGAVHLILADGAKLTATGSGDINNPKNSTPGIQVSGTGNSLTIYAQSTGNQMGQLKATGGHYAAGIGGGNEGNGSNITITGGDVTATGVYEAAGIGGGYQGSGSNITISGGTVTAINKDGFGAGIGGGDGGFGSDITINGGTVEATGGYYGGAGIGGGQSGNGSNITITGGDVTATGGDNGAGIGGGQSGNGSNITITGGDVTATGGDNGAGIGGGKQGSGSYITINGGTVTATGGSSQYGSGSSIGSGYDFKTAASNIKVASYIIVKAGDNENPTDEITNTGGDLANDLADKRYATTEQTANALSIVQTEAIAAIDAAIEGITDTDILAVANQAKTDINAATTIVAVISIKKQTLATISLATAKSSAVAEIDAAIEGVTDTNILAIANKAKEDINAATTKENIDAIKTFALTKINALVLIQTARQGIQNTKMNNWIDGAIKDIKNGSPDAIPGIDEIKENILDKIELFQDGKAEGYTEGETAGDAAGYARGKAEGIEEGKAAGLAEAAAALPTDPEGTTGHTVTITKGEKTLILVNPDKVTYGKQE